MLRFLETSEYLANLIDDSVLQLLQGNFDQVLKDSDVKMIATDLQAT